MSLKPYAALAALVFPLLAEAQGNIIPRPCILPRPVDCPECRVAPPQCPTQPLERTSSQVNVELRDRVLRYEVSETFLNRGGRLEEADYVFPVPAGAAFEDLRLSINGELVSGETMDANKARGIYEEIVRRQRDPALVEYMGSGMFRTRIFPILAGEEKRVVVRFQTVAPREGNVLRIDYKRPSSPTNAIRRVGRIEEDPETFSLVYPALASLGEPYSPTHRLRSSQRGLQRMVSAAGSSPDVVILLPVRGANGAAISMLPNAPGGEDGFALITLTPPPPSSERLPRDVTFVVDVSGSMAGRKLEQAKAAGLALLETLRSNDRFRVVDFSSDVHAFREEFVLATRANLSAARDYIHDLRAEGSTNISGALADALSLKSESGRLPLVVFLTDGEPTVGERNPENIVAAADAQRGEARIFIFGVGQEIHAGLLEQLALRARGTAQFIRPEENVERAVQVLGERLTAPVVTGVRLYVEGGPRLRSLLPEGSVDLFAGQDMILLTRYQGSGTATIRAEGRAGDRTVSWSTRVEFPERTRENPFVPRLWATQRLGWLAAEKRRNGGSSEIDNEIRSLGERFGIPTEFTSYLVVEPGMVAQNGVRLREERQRDNGGAKLAAPAVRAEAAAKSFDAAKEASMQRAVGSVADLDALEKKKHDEGVSRRVGDRIFFMQSGVWTDSRYRVDVKPVRVKPFSTAYFALVSKLPELSQAFALGDRVLVAGRSGAIALDPAGVDTLSDRDVNDLVRNW